jgi:hypothetical protein
MMRFKTSATCILAQHALTGATAVSAEYAQTAASHHPVELPNARATWTDRNAARRESLLVIGSGNDDGVLAENGKGATNALIAQQITPSAAQKKTPRKPPRRRSPGAVAALRSSLTAAIAERISGAFLELVGADAQESRGNEQKDSKPKDEATQKEREDGSDSQDGSEGSGIAESDSGEKTAAEGDGKKKKKKKKKAARPLFRALLMNPYSSYF